MKKGQELISAERKDSEIFALHSLDKWNHPPMFIRFNLNVKVILKDLDNDSTNRNITLPSAPIIERAL